MSFNRIWPLFIRRKEPLSPFQTRTVTKSHALKLMDSSLPTNTQSSVLLSTFPTASLSVLQISHKHTFTCYTDQSWWLNHIDTILLLWFSLQGTVQVTADGCCYVCEYFLKENNAYFVDLSWLLMCPCVFNCLCF